MIEQRIGELLWESGMVILRMKGVFCVEGEEHVLELQAVEDLFEVKLTNTKKNVYGGETRVLIVGENLNSKVIADLLQIHNGDLEQIIN
jgi:G3E family GTPase